MPSVKTKYTPTRMCIGCRKKADKHSFVRLIVENDRLSIDKNQKINARGIYICKDVNCIKRVMKNKTYSKFFKDVSAEEFIAQLEKQ